MSILVDENTRLCVSGITGREGTFHSLRNRDYGTQVVSGVTPGKGGQDVEGIPVFNTFHEAVEKTGYRSSSANFRGIVNQTLNKDKRVVASERGLYQIRKGAAA